ncbi:MAG: BatA domain-containing protein [Planctomycetota bacterium]
MLAIGFAFVAVPLLVHLINMLRHRRQPWAAMDFLLTSYRRQRRWIILRQLLLWLCRTLLAAVLIALLAGLMLGDSLLGIFGTTTTHHVVILDDSYSMGDGRGATYARALNTLRGLATRLSTADGQHQLTVLRSSRASLVVRGGGNSGDAAADLAASTLTPQAPEIAPVMGTSASPVSSELVSAVELATGLIGATPADETITYVFSDYRRPDWQSPERLVDAMESLSATGSTIRFIDCAETAGDNLAITQLEPLPDVWVAGVPVVVRFAIRNYGNSATTNLSVSPRVIQYDQSSGRPDPTRLFSGDVEELPAILIPRIEPGEEIVRQFQVFIAKPGTHAIQLSIPDDALAIDNRRVCTLPLTETQKVLIVDGDLEGRGAFYLSSVLKPGPQIETGTTPDVRPLSFLRSANVDDLSAYRAVYLVNVPQLSDAAATALDQYVRRGGGLSWFLGDRVESENYNVRGFAEGRRLLPAPLGSLTTLQPDPNADAGGGRVADVSTSQTHPLVSILDDRAFGLVSVRESLSIVDPLNDDDSESDDVATIDDSAIDNDRVSNPVRVVVQRRDGQPLVTQHDVGAGRVVTHLFGLESDWTNWPGDPTFVILVLRTNAYLWSGATPATSIRIDQRITQRVRSSQTDAKLMFLPAAAGPPRAQIDLIAKSESGPDESDASDDSDADNSPSLVGEQTLVARIDPREAVINDAPNVDTLLQPGLSEIWLSQLTGDLQPVPIAKTIRTGEGDLRRVDNQEVLRSLQPLDVRFLSIDSILQDGNRLTGSLTTLLLLGLLALLLAIEQMLGYWASYHPPGHGLPANQKSAVRKGGFAAR